LKVYKELLSVFREKTGNTFILFNKINMKSRRWNIESYAKLTCHVPLRNRTAIYKSDWIV